MIGKKIKIDKKYKKRYFVKKYKKNFGKLF